MIKQNATESSKKIIKVLEQHGTGPQAAWYRIMSICYRFLSSMVQVPE
jgi:hypothetical protein